MIFILNKSFTVIVFSHLFQICSTVLENVIALEYMWNHFKIIINIFPRINFSWALIFRTVIKCTLFL